MALLRGVVPVAFEEATALYAPLDVIAVRKLDATGRQELSIGAIAELAARALDESTMELLGVDEATTAPIEQQADEVLGHLQQVADTREQRLHR